MTIVKKLLGFLTLREKFFVAVSIFIRLGLVSLDLAGIFLVGVVVSLISGTTIASSSPLALGLNWLRLNGFENGYAVILVFAIGFFILKGVLSFILTFLTASYVGRIEAFKAREVFDGFLRSSAGAIDKFSKQDILHGLTNSMNAAFGLSITIGAGLLGEVGLLLGVSIYLAYVNVLLFIYTAIFFGSVGLLMYATIGKLSGLYAKRQQDSFMSSQGTLLDAIANYKQILTGDPSGFISKFSFERSKTARASSIYATLSSLPRYITEIAVMVGVGILVLQRGTASSEISATTVAVFLAGIFRIVASMLPLQSGLSYFKRIQHEAELAFQMLEQFGAHTPNFVAQNAKAKRAPKLEIQDLDFSYPGKSGNVLSGLTFTIPSGAYCAVVGKSGAGKSTLVDLILGLYEPDAGLVRVGKQSPRNYMRSNPGSIGYVPQSTALISGTVLENITLQPGLKNIHQEDLNTALRIANLEALISDLPQGLNTMLGQGGISLSGGQAQRVGLARAIYKNPRLLVLDEATSALDEESENSIRVALNNLKGKVTIIVIAHRPSTLRSADMVINIESTKATVFSSYDAYKAK